MRRHVRHILYLSVLTFTVVLVWVGLGIYHSRVASQVSPEVAELIEPISPQFDAEMLNILRARKQVPYNLSESVASFQDGISSGAALLETIPIASSEGDFLFE